jgi:hypothetical protein
MKNLSKSAVTLVVLVVTAAIAMIGFEVWQHQPLSPMKLGLFLLFAAAASALRVKLPGMDSTMSVNLPYILLAAAELSGLEVVAVALVSALVQTLRNRGPVRFVQLLFNACVIVNSSVLAHYMFRVGPQESSPAVLAIHMALAAVGYCVLNTLLVSMIVAFTEPMKVSQAWDRIFLMTFPYYVLSMGTAVMASVISALYGWWAALGLGLLLVGVYRSYRFYFSGGADKGKIMAAAAR